MWRKTKLLKACAIAACLCLSSPFAGICSASQTYTISESELMQLQNHLDALESNNKMLQEILSESDESLTIALDKLMLSQQELTTLRMQLEKAKNDAKNAQDSLQIANLELQRASESFKQSEKERDKIENRLRNQRNIWEFLCAVAVGVAVAR